MVSIRLKPVGKKHQISFRIVVAYKRSKQTGRFIEDLGWYNPHTNKSLVKEARAKYWLSVGAQPTDTVFNIFVNHKILSGPKRPKHKVSKKQQQGEENTEIKKPEESNSQEEQKQKETQTSESENKEDVKDQPEEKNNQEQKEKEVEEIEKQEEVKETEKVENKKEEVAENKTKETSEESAKEEKNQ